MARRPEITFLPMFVLWDRNKDTFWEVGEECTQVSLQEMLGIFTGAPIPEYPEDDEFFETDLERHLETLAYWLDKLEDYAKMEEEIPKQWALHIREDGFVEDGNHRLVVAHILGLKEFPVKLIPRSNPQQPRTIFIDLDETLVRTTRLDGAKVMFIGKSWKQTDREETLCFRAAVKAYQQGDEEDLQVWANRKKIHLFSSVPGRDLGENWATRLRPGAHKFLQQVNQIFNQVNLLTTGNKEFQKGILSLHDIDIYFHNVYGREDISKAQFPLSYGGSGPLTQAEYPILVDDLPEGSSGWYKKMIAMGLVDQEKHRKISYDGFSDEEAEGSWMRYTQNIADKHFVSVPVWHGLDTDTELQQVLRKLQTL